MEIRRFGIGHRRPEGPPGTHGVSGAVIHSDGRATIAELAFARGASVKPHANPNPTWFLVIEGGGFVRVADEQARVGPGDAIFWPTGEVHAAWTELTEMRAIVVEVGRADPATIAGLLGSGEREAGQTGDEASGAGADQAGDPGPSARAHGGLVRDRAPTYDPSHGEPA